MHCVGSLLDFNSRIFGALIVCALYIPLLSNYIDGCVHSDKGSFLSQNVNVLVVNYISLQGDSALLIVCLEILFYVGRGTL